MRHIAGRLGSFSQVQIYMKPQITSVKRSGTAGDGLRLNCAKSKERVLLLSKLSLSNRIHCT